MIDFAKITKTLEGYDCHYFGTREHNGTTLHCFGIMHPHFGVKEAVYDAKGRRLTLAGGQWFAVLDPAFQIVKPKKKVSVTRWISYHKQTTSKNGVSCRYHNEDPSGRHLDDLLDVVEVTKEIEVDE